MKIGITGATGQLGRLVVSKLRSKGSLQNIIALVRNPKKASDLGVESREADYDKPETLAPALKGIDTLLLISGSEVGKRATQHRNIIDAAMKAGVKWIIYTSILHADKSLIDLATEHLATEEALKQSGIPYTLLRNGWYSENYTGSIPGALVGGAFIGSAGNGKIASASRMDYAEAAVMVLTTPGHQGKVYELAGDTAWTLQELAAEISRHSGRNMPYKNLPAEEYADVLKGFNLPEGFAKAIAGWDVAASNDALFDDSHQLSQLIGRPTTPISDTVQKAVKAVSENS